MIRVIIAAFLCAPCAVLAQYALEIIPLRHRTVDQVVPVLQPLVEPGGTLAGQSNQLIVRTSPRNLADIRAALEVIDRPLRRLQVSVRFDSALERERDAVSASGRISGRGADIDVRAQGRREAVQDQAEQRIQVLEGGRAFIATGQSRTLPQRQLIRTPGGIVSQETVMVQDIATGFDVVPRLSGEFVLLEIAPQREIPGALPGSVQSQRAATTLRARLGEWTELAATGMRASRDTGGFGAASRSVSGENGTIWLKVEALD